MVMMIPSKLTHIKKNSHPKNPKKNTTSMIINHPSIHHPLEVGSEKESSISNQPKLPIKQHYLPSIPKLSHICNKRKEKKRKYY
jgi:hypothetical protein